MKRILPLFLSVVMASSMLAGCGSTADDTASGAGSAPVQTETAQTTQSELADGVYTAEFNTDSSMFHVNESKDGKGELTVENGQMTIHVSLVSKNIVNLYLGTAEDAQKDGAELLEPTTDKVTYSDGYEEEVYGFDIPVPAIGEEFDVALVGTKGTWYDHKVSVDDPQPLEAEDTDLADGSYTAEVALEGGSGRATVDSPAELTVEDGEITATIVWSSPYYDYMIVDDERYEPVNEDGNSTFEIPISALDTAVEVSADTTAMSQPHLIDYTLTFDSSTLEEK